LLNQYYKDPQQPGKNLRHSEAILSEQTASLYQAMPISLFASLLNAIILCWLLADNVNHTLIYLWLGISIGVTLFRASIWYAFRKFSSFIRDTSSWVNLFNTGVVLAAISWSFPSVFLFNHADIVHQTFMAFIIAGISAGSVSSLAHLRFPIMSFLSFLLIPLSVRYFIQENIVSSAMGFLTLLFYVFNIRSATSFYNSTRQNIELRLNAIDNENSLRESERNVRTLVNSIPLGVFNYNSNGEITRCNQTLSNMTGKTEEQIIGTKLINKENCGDFCQAILDSLEGKNAYFLGKTQLFDLPGTRKIRTLMRGLRDHDNNINGGVCVIEDISEEERLDKLKNDFVSVVSHELRTPLTTIVGTLKLINSGAISLTDSRASQMISMALNNSTRLHTLINNLLDINKLEQQQIAFDGKEINLLKLAAEAVEKNKTLETSHHVTIELDQSSEPIVILGDKYRLLQAVNNVISNAAKFSPKYGVILIRVGKHENSAVLTIRDNGPGIPQKFQDKIFEKFYQIDSSTVRRFEGSGLGLSIAKSIISQHRGKITVQSQEGCGATFIMEFPLENALKRAS